MTPRQVSEQTGLWTVSQEVPVIQVRYKSCGKPPFLKEAPKKNTSLFPKEVLLIMISKVQASFLWAKWNTRDCTQWISVRELSHYDTSSHCQNLNKSSRHTWSTVEPSASNTKDRYLVTGWVLRRIPESSFYEHLQFGQPNRYSLSLPFYLIYSLLHLLLQLVKMDGKKKAERMQTSGTWSKTMGKTPNVCPMPPHNMCQEGNFSELCYPL
jgi:hypothetical protein